MGLTKYVGVEFTVLMSVYNAESADNLNQAIESIEKQTILPKEFILVLDGPVSERLEYVIKDHQKRAIVKIRVIHFKENKGLGVALRAGALEAKTPWIARMDSDDVSVVNRFEIQIQYLTLHPDISLFGGQVDEFSNTLANITGSRIVPTTYSEILRFGKYRSPFNHPTVFIKRSALMEIGSYRNFPSLEDYDLWSRFLVHGYKVSNVDDILVHMRTDSGLIGRRGGRKYLIQYFRLRNNFVKIGFLNLFEALVGDGAMIVSTAIGGKLRSVIYKIFLRK